MKARHASEVKVFKDIPNIGPAAISDFKVLGITTPAQLKTQDPMDLYTTLCTRTGMRHDPCVLDTFMAAVDFMNGADPHPWWHYTAERKRVHPDL